MSTFEVKVVKIDAIEPIENADNIELAVVGDYRSVVKKGQFSVGQLAVYIPEAAIIPDNLLRDIGLEGKLTGSGKNRVKAVKLRGCLSQGILYSVHTEFPGGLPYGQGYIEIPGQADPRFVNEGDSVADDLNIIKYEPPIPTSMGGEVYNAGQHLTIAYDIENCKNFPNILIDGEQVYFTEKIHGSFCGVGILPEKDWDEKHFMDRFVIFSKGLGAQGLCFKHVEINEKNVYIRALRYCEVFDKLNAWISNPRLNHDVPFFLLGEVYGNVQDLAYGTDLDFRVFDMATRYRGQQKFASYNPLMGIANMLDIETVPVLYTGPYSKEAMMDYTSGKETVSGNNLHMREGIVIKPMEERRDDEIGRVILKSVSAEYLLRKNKNATEYN